MEKSCENCKYMNPNCSDEDWCTHADVPFQEFTCGGKETFYCKYWEEKEEKKCWPSDLGDIAECLRIGIIHLQSKIRLLERDDC